MLVVFDTPIKKEEVIGISPAESHDLEEVGSTPVANKKLIVMTFTIYMKGTHIQFSSGILTSFRHPNLTTEQMKAEIEFMKWIVKYCEVYIEVWSILGGSVDNLPEYVVKKKDGAEKRILQMESRIAAFN